MSNTCHRLTETYNTNVLQSASTIEKVVFYTEAEKHKSGIKGNTTLIQLINNHRLNKEPTPKLIAGPRSLSLHYNKQYQLTVYTFGERHADTNDCPTTPTFTPIEDFLQRQIATTSAFIDMYVELPTFEGQGIDYIEKTGVFYYGTIGRIAKKLKECLVPHTRANRLCNLVRLHYIDIRKGEKPTNPLSLLRPCLRNKTCIKLHMDTIRKLGHENIDVYRKFLLDQITLNPPLLKELNKSFLKDEILKFGTQQLLQYGMNIRDTLRENISSFNYQAIYNIIAGLNGYLIDMYTLSRIFKKFNVENDNINQPTSPHNIIIYTGEFHSGNYRKFLESIGSKEIAHAGPRNYKDLTGPQNCLDTTNFPMPFFRN